MNKTTPTVPALETNGASDTIVTTKGETISITFNGDITSDAIEPCYDEASPAKMIRFLNPAHNDTSDISAIDPQTSDVEKLLRVEFSEGASGPSSNNVQHEVEISFGTCSIAPTDMDVLAVTGGSASVTYNNMKPQTTKLRSILTKKKSCNVAASGLVKNVTDSLPSVYITSTTTTGNKMPVLTTSRGGVSLLKPISQPSLSVGSGLHTAMDVTFKTPLEGQEQITTPLASSPKVVFVGGATHRSIGTNTEFGVSSLSPKWRTILMELMLENHRLRQRTKDLETILGNSVVRLKPDAPNMTIKRIPISRKNGTLSDQDHQYVDKRIPKTSPPFVTRKLVNFNNGAATRSPYLPAAFLAAAAKHPMPAPSNMLTPKGKRRFKHFTPEEMLQAHMLYTTCGSKGYAELLKMNMMMLPSERTLHRKFAAGSSKIIDMNEFNATSQSSAASKIPPLYNSIGDSNSRVLWTASNDEQDSICGTSIIDGVSLSEVSTSPLKDNNAQENTTMMVVDIPGPMTPRASPIAQEPIDIDPGPLASVLPSTDSHIKLMTL